MKQHTMKTKILAIFFTLLAAFCLAPGLTSAAKPKPKAPASHKAMTMAPAQTASLSLAWDEDNTVTGITSYKVYYDTVTGPPYTQTMIVQGDVRTATVPGLDTSATWYFSVSCFIGPYESYLSTEFVYQFPVGTPTPTPTPPPPPTPTVTPGVTPSPSPVPTPSPIPTPSPVRSPSPSPTRPPHPTLLRAATPTPTPAPSIRPMKR